VAGAIIAFIVDVLIFFLATATFGHDLLVQVGPDPPALTSLNVVMIAVVVALAAAGASLLVWLLGHLASRPFLIFWIVAGIFFLLSLVPAMATPGPGETRATLFLLHLATALSLTGALTLLAGESD
jgi:hypothetical protein